MQDKYKLLYVFDEIKIRKNIIDYIQEHYNIAVIKVTDSIEAWNKYNEYKPEIIITDLSIKGSPDLELIENIREIDKAIKVIIVSMYTEKERLLRAIKLNLIEYYTDPINILALKKSLNLTIKQLTIEDKDNIIYFDKTSFYNLKTDELSINNEIIKLTQSELKLLKFFLENKNKPIESPIIFNELWEYSKEYRAESVRTLIKKLRKKLPENLIDNIYGGLYRFNL